MGLKLITPPDAFPVTLEEVKAQLSIEDTDWDDMLMSMIQAATESFDGPYGDLCGRALMPQTWDYYRDNFPSVTSDNATGGIRIPLPPLIEVESVNYVDPDTQLEVALATSEYEVDAIGTPYGWVMPVVGGFPTPMETTNAVRVRFTAGYPVDGDSPAGVTVPAGVRQAIILLVIDMYAKGSAFVDRSQTTNRDAIENLIRHHVIRTV
jgi:uncharacterized phiE125 gp8 family phage protein